MERNADLGVQDFYLHQDSDGKVEFGGSMELSRVMEIVQKRILELEEADTTKWIPDAPLPELPADLDEVIKTPDLLKKTSKTFMNWLLGH